MGIKAQPTPNLCLSTYRVGCAHPTNLKDLGSIERGDSQAYFRLGYTW